jgi:NADH-quinone oxidoreductase subunit J
MNLSDVTTDQWIFLAAAFCGGWGLWLMLPRRGQRGRALGAVLGVVMLGLLMSRIDRLGDWLTDSVFLVLAAVTLLSAGATITFRNPVYCAIWFALTLLGVSGLLFLQGAQFLGVATLTVYAGAILVMFLFVLMFANPSGRDYYDRMSWEPWLAAPAAAVIVVALTVVVVRTLTRDETPAAGSPIAAAQITAAAREAEILAGEHMAHLGRRLFSQYLVAIEIAGTLLLVALVGAVAIVMQDKPSKHARREARHG